MWRGIPIFWIFGPIASPGVAGGTTKLGLTAGAERGVDRHDQHMHVGDATVGDERLGAVEDPLVVCLVPDCGAAVVS